MRAFALRGTVLAGAIAAGVALAGGAAASTSTSTGSKVPAPSGPYQVTVLSSLGGTTSIGNSINNRGWIAGISNLPGDNRTEAALWRGSKLVPLGTLGGPNSAVLWPVHDTDGVVVGVSETAEVNPFGEAWSCSVFFPSVTHHVCVGFVWRHGLMRALRTFGGPDGFATAANNHGLVVGWAENTVHDRSCRAPQVLQFRAALWNLHRGTIRQLPPLRGDSTSAADAINSHGEAVGISGSCDVAVGAFSARHAVVWRDGKVSKLPSLGVPAWNTAMEVNDAGVVVGFVNARTPGGSPAVLNPRAALWTPSGVLHNLRTLPGYANSLADGVNDHGQVVGDSCPASGLCHAFVWQNGTMYDLNQLVASGPAGLVLEVSGDINNAGVITGEAYDQATGVTVAFRATPVTCSRPERAERR